MRILITSSEHRIRLCLPLCALRLLPTLAAKNKSDCETQQQSSITPSQLRALLCELRRAKKTFGSLVLVDVLSSDGQSVKITL